MLGDSSLFAGQSYLGVGRETTYGTYATCTAGLDFISESLKILKDSKILQQVERSRTMSKSFSLGKVVEGDIEFYAYPEDTALAYFIQNAFGGAITSLTATGGTGAGFTHTFNIGNFSATHNALSFNVRKGPATSGKVFEYSGGRVSSLSIAAELDEPVVITASMICKDGTYTSNDIESAFTHTAKAPLSFASGRLSIESTTTSFTTTSYWHVQNINFTMNNNLKNDSSARRIGSDTLDILPYGVQSYELSCDVRFDTTTAYDAMIAQTELRGQFEFLGATIPSSGSAVQGLKFNFQKLTVKDAGDPEVAGPDEILTATVTFNVLRDESASGYAVNAELTNAISSY